MRIAVCLSGQLRNWELAYSNQINHWLYGGHEVDYFTHTWDEATEYMNNIPTGQRDYYEWVRAGTSFFTISEWQPDHALNS